MRPKITSVFINSGEISLTLLGAINVQRSWTCCSLTLTFKGCCKLHSSYLNVINVWRLVNKCLEGTTGSGLGGSSGQPSSVRRWRCSGCVVLAELSDLLAVLFDCCLFWCSVLSSVVLSNNRGACLMYLTHSKVPVLGTKTTHLMNGAPVVVLMKFTMSSRSCGSIPHTSSWLLIHILSLSLPPPSPN